MCILQTFTDMHIYIWDINPIMWLVTNLTQLEINPILIHFSVSDKGNRDPDLKSIIAWIQIQGSH